jgi:hypothetical protein
MIGVHMYLELYLLAGFFSLFICSELLYLYSLIFYLKSVLSNMRIATHVCFLFLHNWYIFSQPFTFSLCVSLVVRCVSCRQKIVGSWFLIQSDNLGLLITELSSFTFRVMIERCFLISVFPLLFSPDWVLCWLFFAFGFVQLQVLLVFWADLVCCFPTSCRFDSFPCVLFFPRLSYLWLFHFLPYVLFLQVVFVV